MSYVLHLAVMIGIYSIMAYSLNLVVGYGGLLSLCHAAYYGIGAYSYALLVMHFQMPFVFALICAVLLAGLAGAAIAFPALRFRGDMFVFVTLGCQVIVFTLLYNWVDLTRGYYGISGIPRPSLFGTTITTPFGYVVLVTFANGILLPMLFALYRSPFGLSLKALRENERAAAALGIPANLRYTQAMALSAGFAAVSGALYAGYVTYIDPTSFTLQESIFLLAILLLGGSGNIIGPLIGVVVMLLLPEALRFIGLPDTIAPNVREILYGILLIVLMFIRPQGIAGDYQVR